MENNDKNPKDTKKTETKEAIHGNDKNEKTKIKTKEVEQKDSKIKTKKVEQKDNEIKSGKRRIFPFVLIGIFIIVILVFSVIFSLINIGNDKIIGKVSIMGIDVSNMTKEQATEVLKEIIHDKMSEELVLKKDDYETSINANQINAQFNTEEAVQKAYDIGRSGNIITNNYNILASIIWGNNIELQMNYEQESLDKKIDDISSKLPDGLVQNSYYIEDDELIIVKGKKGLVIKEDELENSVINEMKAVNKKYNILNIPTQEVEPDAIDIEKIRNEIYKEPQNASVSKDKETGKTQVNTHVNGVDFDISIEEAKKIIAEDKEEYVIPLKIIVPDKTLSDLGEEAFPDKLSEYSTIFDSSNRNRSNNLAISAEKIDGTIIMPGETFSYNQTVGERTIAAGYKEAGAYAGGKVVQDVGGGICQTSSTLYNAALLANLEIVDRSNHQFLTSYVDASRDATVAWGSIDFQFKNTRTYPIKIEASAKNGVCEMAIYGIKEDKEYEVVIESEVLSYIPFTTKYENDDSLEEGEEVIEQSGYTGCTSEAYKILKLNGKVVSKTLLSKDTYDPMTRIIRRGTKKETVESSADTVNEK